MKNSLYVITGGPGAGKTAILDELQRRGHICVPEVARELIREQVRSGGDALPWGDRAQYARLMLDWSVSSYLKHASARLPTFFDRGIPDTLCYARLIDLQQASAERIKTACAQCRYNSRVFIAPPWEEIYETDQERKQTFAEAVRTYQTMWDTYQQCRYELLEIPRGTPAERAGFIMESIGHQ